MNLLAATGRLGQDATLKYTANQDAICNFSLSLTAGYGDKATTTWVSCNLWGKRAEILAPMLLKGTQIGLTGEISLRPYKAKDGTEKSSLECRVGDVTLLGVNLKQVQRNLLNLLTQWKVFNQIYHSSV